MLDIDIRSAHARDCDNQIADVLSRWQNMPAKVQFLYTHVPGAVWLPVSHQLLEIDSQR